MKNGWFCMYRKIQDWEWYNHAATTKIYLDCLVRAYFANSEWRGVKIKKGQFPTTVETLATVNGLTIQQTRTALKNLQTTNEIEVFTTNRYSIITVKNWDSYQYKNRQANKQTTGGSNKQSGGANNKPYNNNINNKTINSNTSYIIVSLSIEERELLEKYLLKQKRKTPIDDIDAYISTLSKNGDLANKLEKAKKWHERQQAKNQEEQTQQTEETPINTEEDEQKIREIQQNLKRRLKNGRKPTNNKN